MNCPVCRLPLLCAVCLLWSVANGTPVQVVDSGRGLVDAIAKVESSGNPNAIGDGGKAYGLLQIRQEVLTDYNRAKGTGLVMMDAFDPIKARMVFRWYVGHYATEKRLGRPPTIEDMARIWNGGPNGWKKTATLKYWVKVKRVFSDDK